MRLPLLPLGAVTLLLTGCATGGSDPSVCPAPVEYPPALQARAADELEALPEGSALAILLEDYARERARLRACRGR